MENIVNDLPPHSHEAELGIIGCLLLDPNLAKDLPLARFTPDWIYTQTHRIIIGAITAMVSESTPVDIITLSERLKSDGYLEGVGGVPYLIEAGNSVPSAGNFTYYLEILREKTVERRLQAGLTGVIQNAREGATVDIPRIEQIIADARAVGTDRDHQGTTAKMACLRFAEWLEQRIINRGKLSGVPTGIRMLDKILDGIQYAELTLIAARPSIGKTALGCCVTTTAISAGIPTLFVTAEMSDKMIVRRLISNHASVSMTSLKEGVITDSEHQRIVTAMHQISRAPLHFEEQMGGATLGKLLGSIHHHIRKNGVKLVVIDYIQKFKTDSKVDKRTEELEEICDKVQYVARKTGVAILALAQISRDSEKEKKPRAPRLADLSDSKALEAHADTVILIHRERGTSGEAELIVAKQRDGECANIKAHYEGKYCRFANIETSIDHSAK